MSFDLTANPWIPVTLTNGGTDIVSLRACFERAGEIRRLSPELPTQGFALLRVLLAICHDAVGFHEPGDIEVLYENGVDTDRVLDYLSEYEDRFNLFHPERPFFQVANLRTAKGTHSSLASLIADVPNNAKFMTTRGGTALDRISAAEAALWLVHAQAFDPSGIRSGAVGDPEVKGGKGYPIGPAWSGHIGGVVLHGRTLSETLTYNITPTPENDLDRPVWALPDPQTEQRALEPRIPGPVSVLAWQSRRIRLIGDATGVTGVVLCQGDRLTPRDRRDVESMTAWRFSAPQTKKNSGKPTYMPLKHDPERASWRGLPALVDKGAPNKDGFPVTYMAGTLSSLRDNAPLGSNLDLSVRVETVGMSYGNQEATVENISHDQLDLRLSLLGDSAAEVRTMIGDCIATADACVKALGILAADLARAAGDVDGTDGALARGKQLGWSAIDGPARLWIGELSASSDLTESRRAWQTILCDTLNPLAHSLLAGAGAVAVAGRRGSYGFINSALAQQRFRSALFTNLPLAFEAEKKEEVSA